jgi:hypothetical protein
VAREVWDNNKELVALHSPLDMLRLFQGTTTTNFKSAVAGVIGEFGAAVIYTYFARRLGNNSWGKILGSIAINGKKPKTDIEIFNSIGIQVKNYMVNKNYMRDITTNITPSKFDSTLNDEVKTNFLDFITNYFFNLSYANIDDVEQTYNTLPEYLG